MQLVNGEELGADRIVLAAGAWVAPLAAAVGAAPDVAGGLGVMLQELGAFFRQAPLRGVTAVHLDLQSGRPGHRGGPSLRPGSDARGADAS